MQRLTALTIVAALGMLVGPVWADVLDMGGSRNAGGSWTGLASVETVHVGNPGNAADTRYDPNGFGRVDYEYNIGKYEVTAGQYTEFLNAVATKDAHGLYNPEMFSSATGCKIERSGVSGSYVYTVASDYANRPVNYVSWADAARFANWLDNGQPTGGQDGSTTEDGAYSLNGMTSYSQLLSVTRQAGWTWAVASEDEWYKAAYYDPGTNRYHEYPTNSDGVPSNDLLSPDPGNNANFNQGGYTLGSPYYLTDVGEFENSDSPFGTFDQGGNVWEWNEAVVSASYRGLRGGSFLHQGYLGASSRDDYYFEFYPTGEHDTYGFRVAQVPEPATLTLLALGGLLLRKRWRPAKGGVK